MKHEIRKKAEIVTICLVEIWDLASKVNNKKQALLIMSDLFFAC